MTKQFNLALISDNTLVEKKSGLTLKYKVIEDEVWESGKIVVGLPLGRQSNEWTNFVFRCVHVYTNTRPYEKKYPVMLEYDDSHTSVSYMAEINGEPHVLAVINEEAVLVKSSEEMVPQESVFVLDSKEGKLIPFSSQEKCLYWNVDNEFKIIDRASIDTQIFSPNFSLGDSEGKEVPKVEVPKVSDLPAIKTVNEHVFVEPPKVFKQRVIQQQQEQQRVNTITARKNQEKEAAEIFIVFLIFLYLVISAILIIYEPRMAFVSGAFLIIFISLAESALNS